MKREPGRMMSGSFFIKKELWEYSDFRKARYAPAAKSAIFCPRT